MKNRTVMATILLLAGIIAGCSGGNSTSSTTAQVPIPVPIPFQEIQTIGTVPKGLGTSIFRSTAEWSDFWNSSFLLPPSEQIPPVPSVDFSKNYVIAVVNTIGGSGTFKITGVQTSATGIN